MKISVSDILADFKRMYDEHWSYGVETKEGNVDCSGAFVWSYRQHGQSIYHGSNRIARTEVEKLIPIAVANITPGMAAFKTREPGTRYYALPESYKNGSDLKDYYHIGLVAEDTSYVYNAKGAVSGFCKDSSRKGWTYVAYLKKVDYGTQTIESVVKITMTSAKVTGGSLNLRKSTSTSSEKITSIPENAIVSVLEETSDDWSKIQYQSYEGYVMKKYLTIVNNVSVELPSETWELILTAINKGLNAR